VPKLCGYDGEVGNFISGVDRPDGTGKEASKLILSRFRGFPGQRPRTASSYRPAATRHYGGVTFEYGGEMYAVQRNGHVTADSGDASAHTGGFNPQDHGRTYLAENGGCVYIDLDHVELCLPEVVSAYDHVACWHAMLRLLRNAVDAVNRDLPPGQRVHVLVNNSDGQGHSYGSHVNFLITERCRRNVFMRKMHHLMYLAAYQVSSILFTGQGKVGSEDGASTADFQLSQRADFMRQLVGSHTTFSRPIVNARDEPHCGAASFHRESPGDAGMARLHVIFYDSTLCHVASLLKVGVMQIILAMIEAECVNHDLLLEDPVQALAAWSRDLTFTMRARTLSGRALSAVDLQCLFLEEAARFVAAGGCEGIVPRASSIIELWADTLERLKARDLAALARHLDWALKLSILERVMSERSGLDWNHPAIKRLDLVYSSIGLDDGLYWACESDGAVERVVGEADIERFRRRPPEDTRAWTRAMLLRRAGRHRVESVDWDEIKFTTGGASERTLELSNPLGFTKAATGTIIDNAASLDDILDALQAQEGVSQ
jgi:proteasome accessory factor A